MSNFNTLLPLKKVDDFSISYAYDIGFSVVINCYSNFKFIHSVKHGPS